MQSSKLYVGNISYTTTKEQLNDLFKQYGTVKDVRIIEGRGFAFVEMSTLEEAEKAKTGLDGQDFMGRNLKIDEARPPRKRDMNRGGGGGRRRF